MITTAEEVTAILNENPEIPIEEFWPTVGIDPEIAKATIIAHSIMAGVSTMTAGGLIETGATLAKAGLERQQPTGPAGTPVALCYYANGAWWAIEEADGGS